MCRTVVFTRGHRLLVPAWLLHLPQGSTVFSSCLQSQVRALSLHISVACGTQPRIWLLCVTESRMGEGADRRTYPMPVYRTLKATGSIFRGGHQEGFFSFSYQTGICFRVMNQPRKPPT